ncbi:MAG: hypothetical protein IPL21_09865 [Saprospirales bacterium]|nr:hypothetical protein [Saprospirales bacterium]
MQLQKSTIPSLDIGGFMTPEQLVAFGNKFNTLLGVQLDQFYTINHTSMVSTPLNQAMNYPN